MRRLFVVAGLILAGMIWMPFTASALTISASDAQGRAGQADIPVVISIDDIGPAAVYGIDIQLEYNASLITAQEVERSTSISDWSISYDNSDRGRVKIALYGTSPLRRATDIAEISFNVLSSARSGGSSPLDFTRADYNEQPAETRLNGTFRIISESYTINIIAVNGSVSKSPDRASYNSNEEVSLTATPSSGYSFIDWSGDLSGRQNPAVIVMDSDKTVTANFEPSQAPTPTYTITANAGSGGSISPSGTVTIAEGESQLFRISANSGYAVSDVTVDGDSVGAVTSYTFRNVNANHTIEAGFQRQQPPDQGELTVSVSDARGLPGQTGIPVAIRIEELGSRQVYGVDLVLSYNSRMIEAKDVDSAIPSAGWTINANTDRAGEVTIGLYGTSPLAGAGALANITFDVLSSASGGSRSSLTLRRADFNEQGADEINNGEFVIINGASSTYTITSEAGSGGSISPSGQVRVDEGDSRSFTIRANSGYAIDDVEVDGSSVGGVTRYRFRNVAADHAIEASFRALVPAPPTPSAQKKLRISVRGRGRVYPGSGYHRYNKGETVEIRAVADEGYYFERWSGDLSGDSNPASITMDDYRSITAYFAAEGRSDSPPHIKRLSPRRLRAGRYMVIRGSGFGEKSSVGKVVLSNTDARKEAIIKHWKDTQIRCIAPKLATGSYDVQVICGGAESNKVEVSFKNRDRDKDKDKDRDKRKKRKHKHRERSKRKKWKNKKSK